MDPLKIGPAGVDAFIPLDPQYAPMYALGEILGENLRGKDWANALRVPFDNIREVCDFVNGAVDNVDRAQREKYVLEEVLLENLAMQGGGQAGALVAGFGVINNLNNMARYDTEVLRNFERNGPYQQIGLWDNRMNGDSQLKQMAAHRAAGGAADKISYKPSIFDVNALDITRPPKRRSLQAINRVPSS